MVIRLRSPWKGRAMLDFRVNTFLAVCRKLNYTHAARELNLTQSAVSQQMAYLERHYGVKLVEFEGKAMRLTEAGAMLYRAFQSFSHDESLLTRRLAALECGQMRLDVGMTLTAGEYIVAEPLARYLGKRSDLRISTVSRSTEELLRDMAKGRIDCAFLEGFFDKSQLAWDTLCTQRLVCICAQGHPLAGREASIEDLLAEPLIVREPESGSRAVLEHALARRNLTLASFARSMEASSIGVIKAFVRAGQGISFVYEAAVRESVRAGEVSVISVSGEPIEHDISFVRPYGSLFEEEFRRLFDGVFAEYRASAAPRPALSAADSQEACTVDGGAQA